MIPGYTQQLTPGLGNLFNMGGFTPQNPGYNFGVSQPQQDDPFGVRAKEAEMQQQKEILALRKKAQASFEQGQQAHQKAAAMEAPKQHQPMGYRDLLPLGIAALAAKLFGATDRDLAQGGQGFIQGRQAYAQTQDQNAQNQFNTQQHGFEQLGQLGMQGAQFYGGQADDATRSMQYEQGRLDTLTAKADAATEKRISDARNAYDRANLEGEKRRAASVLQKLDPSYITPDQVEADVRDLKSNNLQRATSELAREINNIDRGRGFVDDTNGAALEARAQSIAKQYGVDRASLPIVPTGTTLQKQHYDQLKSQFDQTFKFRSDSFKTTTAQAWARIEIAKKQLEINREGLGLRAGGLDLSERRFQYQINKDAGLILGASTKELVKARHDLAVEQAKLDQMKARNPATFGVNLQDEATAKQQAKVQDMQDEVAALEQLQRMAGEEVGDSGGEPAPTAEPTPGQGGNVPAKIGGLPPGPIGGGGKTGTRTKPTAPKTKPKASAPKGQQVYNQGGVTIRKRG